MERVLGKVDHQLSSLRDECYMAAVGSVQTLVQKDLGATSMMTKIDHELSQQRQKVNRLTLGKSSATDFSPSIYLGYLFSQREIQSIDQPIATVSLDRDEATRC